MNSYSSTTEKSSEQQSPYGKTSKIILILTICAVGCILTFFIVRQIVFDSVSENASNEMNEKLGGKTFVAQINEDIIELITIEPYKFGTPLHFKRIKYENGEEPRTVEENAILSYTYSYWGNITNIKIPSTYGSVSRDVLYSVESEGDVISFGDYSLATDEVLETVKKFEERAASKSTLGNFLMTAREYKKALAYAGGSYHFEDNETTYVYDNNKMPYVRMSEYDVMYPTVSRLMCLWESFTIDDDAGMLTPITVYLENIPGSITSVRKLVDRWDSVSKSTGDGGSFSSFKEGGITYTRTESSKGSILLEIEVQKNHVIYLADYND